MTHPDVQLYVYDLSNGLARALSLPLTGKQIDGIWHTSVVVYGREIFYGAGVMETAPGRSHHGNPLHVIPMGPTQIPPEIFDDYLSDLKERYTAGNYHLLEFNCNSFTQDVVGFLTGASIPSWISSLPADFLSTPFGRQMKPQIDAMYTGRAGGSAVVGGPGGQGGNGAMGMGMGGLLAGIAGQAAGPPGTSSLTSNGNGNSTKEVPGTTTSELMDSAASSLMIITNPASFDAALSSHPNSVALFRPVATSEDASSSSSSSSSSAAAQEVERKFEEMAREEASENKVDLDYLVVDVNVGKGLQVAKNCGVEKELERGPVVVLFRKGVKSDTLTDLDEDTLEAGIVWHIAQVQEERSQGVA